MLQNRTPGLVDRVRALRSWPPQRSDLEQSETARRGPLTRLAATALLAWVGLAGTEAAANQKGTTTLWLDKSFIEEDGGTQTVVLKGRVDGGLSGGGLYPIDVGGTAVSGTDYTITQSATHLDIPSVTGLTYTITPINNSSKAADKTITFSFTGGPYATAASTTLTLADDEVTLSVNRGGTREFYGSQLVTVTATSGKSSSARTVAVQVGKSGDSATEGTDYSTVGDFDITIPANATSGTGTFTLTPKQDTSVEGDETISISGTLSGSTVTGSTIYIYDDDMSLSVNPTSVYESDNPTTITVTANGGSHSIKARTVRVKVGKSGDTATSGTDYQHVADFDITIPKNNASATGTFTLTPIDNYDKAPQKSLSVSGSVVNHNVAGTTIYVADNEGRGDVTLTLDKSSVSESGGAQKVEVEVSNQVGDFQGECTVTVRVGHSSDSATEGTDYSTVNDFTIYMADQQRNNSKEFTVTPTNDGSVEGTERIAVTASADYCGSVDSKYLHLTDDDGTTIALSASSTSVSEDASGTSVTVTATAATAQSAATTVNVEIGATGTATYGQDYSAAKSNFDISIPANSTTGTKSFTLTPTDDTLVEGDETIGITGRSTGHSVTAGSITLSDNDSAPSVNLSLDRSSVSEGASGTVVTVSAAFSNSTLYPSDKTVTVSVGGSGTATSGTDYTAVSNFDITIKGGASSGSGTFTLTPTNDTAVEGDETIGVSGTSTGLTVNGATLTMTDNDSDTVTLSSNTSSVAESGSKTTVTVTATANTAIPQARTVTVAVGSSTDGATEGTDYATVDDFTITIAANATTGTGTFTLTPTQDTSAEGSESVGITGSGTLMAVTGTSLNITDDDTRTIDLSVDKTTVGEGDGATTVTVTATAKSAVTEATKVTVSVGASGDGATEGTDYTTVADFDITIAANTTSKTGTFTLTPTDDSTYEGDESVSVTGSASPHTVNGTSLAIGNNDGIGITLTTSPTSVVEGAGATSVTVTATAAKTTLAAIDVAVSVGKSTDTATEGTDYPTVKDFTLTIPKGKTKGTATFTLIPNSDKKTSESDETISIDGSSSPHTVTGASLTLSNATASNPITLSVSPASVGEAAGATTVTVTAKMKTSFVASTDLTVTVGTSGSATSGTDYAAVSDITLTFAANSTTATGTFTLTPTNDSVVEPNETVWVDGTSSSGQVVGTSVTINDDDGAGITLSASPSSVSEGASGTTVTVTATPQNTSSSARTVTVAVGKTGDSAIEGTDYSTVSDFDITIAANAASQTGTFTLTPTQDTVVEGSESLTIAGSGTGLNVTGTSVSLTDDDTAPAVNLSVSPTSVTEGAKDTNLLLGSYKTVTVTATFSGSNTYDHDKTVAVSVGGSGSATSGTDYTAVSDFNVKISAGQKSGTGTFQLTATDDSVYEGDETIGVASTSTGLTVNSVDLTLADNDSAAVTVDDAEAEEGSDITFTVTLDNAVQGGLTVTPDFTDVTAVEGTDYDENTAALSFTGTANETKTFTVSTTQDAVVETDETFTVGLTVSDAPSGVTSTDTGTGTIKAATGNNADEATLTINDASADEGDSITFTVTLDKAVQGGLTVTPGFTDVSAVEGTDYDENTTALSFAGTADETKTFTVSTTEDAVLESNETFTVGLAVSGTTLGDRITSTDTGTGTINNDDEATVTIDDANADEGDAITFTVTLSEAVQGGLKVTPDFTDVTAVEGTDYDENTTALTFTGTKAETQTFTVSTTEDAVFEGNETFTVGLTVSGQPSGTTVTATDTGTGTINNDDTAAVTINDADADEGDDITFTVTLDKAVQGGLTVTPSFTDVTAVEGTDYDENTTALTFTGTANETKTFTVSTTEETNVEGNETFTVGLSVSNAPDGITATDTGTGTINDDDSSTITIDDASASEGDGITFTVTLSQAVQGGLTVTPDFTDVTAVEGTDYDENTTALTFTGTKGETQTFTVSTTEDAVLESAETFTVGLSVSNAPNGITATDTGTGTINNDDGATVTVNDANASEGDAITFTVTLSEAVQGGLKVTPGFTDVTAVEGTDYDENTAALTFSGTKGETQTFTVDTTEDVVIEGNETFTVGLSVSDAPSGTTVTSSDTGTGTINNDDGATVTINDANADEGDAITFTVTLSETVQGGLTVTPSYTDGTTTAADYTKNTTALTFSGTANETKTFTVSTTEDAALEGNETFTVGLSVSNAPSGITATDTGTGTINNDDGATVTINDANADEGDSMTFTVTLSEAVQGGLTVTPGYTHGTTADNDFTKNTTALSFTGTKGETQTLTVSTTEDAVFEGDETFTVGLSVSGAPSGVTAPGTGTGTIKDDETASAVNLSLSPATVAENAGSTTVTVKAALSTSTPFATDRTVTVKVGADGDTAKSGTDYEAVTDFDVTIKAGKASGEATFTLKPADNNIDAANKSIKVSGTSTGLTVSAATLSLTDDDATPSVDLTLNPTSVTEDAGATTVTVTGTLSSAVRFAEDRTVTVSVGANGDTATSGTDYAAVTDFDLTIAKGQESGSTTFTFTPTKDSLVESNETITLSGASAAGLTVGTTTLDLTDGPLAGQVATVALSASPSSVSEDAGATRVTVTAQLSGAYVFAQDTTVTATVGADDDSARSGHDYAAVADFEIAVAAGQGAGSATFTLTPTPDSYLEGGESLTISGSADNMDVEPTRVKIAEGGVGASPESIRFGLIADPAEVPEGGGAQEITVTAWIGGGGVFETGREVWTDIDPGTATEGTDYEVHGGLWITIPAGETEGSGTFTLAPVDDAVLEADETVMVEGMLRGWGHDTTDVHIVDDDEAYVEVSDARAAEGETLAFAVSLGNAAAMPLEIGYETRDGTADAGADYAATSGVLTIPAGATTAMIAVETLDDALPEIDETMTLALTVPPRGLAPGLYRGDKRTGTGTITSDDIATLTVGPATATEGSDLVFEASLSAPAPEPVAFSYSTTDGTATAAADYAAASGVATIPAGATSATVTVATTDDDLPELDETMTLSIGAPDSGLPAWARIGDNTAQGTILNDDVVAISVAPTTADEGANLVFRVTMSMVAGEPVNVAYATSDGTAIAGDDYTAASGIATIPAGATSATVAVATTADDLPELDEDMTLSIGAPDSGLPAWARIGEDSAEGTILNDDFVAISVAPTAADEGTDLVFRVSLSMVAGEPVNVDYATSDGTAKAGADYTAVSGTLTVPAGSLSASINVTTIDDNLAEPAETLTLTLAEPAAGFRPWARIESGEGTAEGTIRNDDIARISIASAEAREGSDLTFPVSLSTPSAAPVELSYATADGTARSGDDYEAANGRLTIAAGVTSATLTVRSLEDGWVEGDESLALSLAAVDGGLPAAVEFAATQAAGTIFDIDVGDIRVEPATADEGERLSFDVTLSAPAASDIALSWGTADGTARAADKDYAAESGRAATIAAGELGARLEVDSLADLFVEPDETFEVRVVAAGELPPNVSIISGSAVGTIADDDGATATRLGKIHEPILADLSLAMTESVVDAVSGRIEAAAWGTARRFDYAGSGTVGYGQAGMSGGAFGMSPQGGFGMSANGLGMDNALGMLPGGGFGTAAGNAFGMDPQGGFGTPSTGMFDTPFHGADTLGAHAGMFGPHPMSTREKLGGMSFEYAFRDRDGDEGEGRNSDIAVWGTVDLRPLGGSHDFEVPGESATWDGDVLGVIVGADGRMNANLLAGLAVSRFDSEFDYTAREAGEEFAGVYETSMTSLHPYANWVATPRLDFWATTGFGEGEIMFAEEAWGAQRADSEWLTGAVGGEYLLTAGESLIPGGVTTLDLKADAFATRLDVEDNGELIEALSVRAHRLRLGLIGEYARAMESGAVFAPSLELAARRDGGAGETGAGVEIGSKLRYVSPGGRLTIDAHAHVLAAFQGEKHEWGVGGAVQLAPGPDGRGWSLILNPSYGPVGTGAEGMWRQRSQQHLRQQQQLSYGAAFDHAPAARFDGMAGYGLALRGGGLLTLLTGLSWQETGAPRESVGALLRHRSVNLRFDMERARTHEGPEYGVLLRAERVIGGALGATPLLGR